MNLLIDAHCFDYKTSEGINTYIRGLYCELIKIAQDIDFYIVASDIKKVKNIFGEGPNITYIPLTSSNKIYRILFEFPLIIKKYKIDYAHFQYTSPLIKNCKTIVTLHDILFLDYPQYFPSMYRLVKGLLFKLSAKRANLLLTVSEYSKNKISMHYHIPKNYIFVTPNAVSEEFYHTDINEAKNFVKKQGLEHYLLYVSRIEPRKNQIALLKAYCELKLWEKGYDLVFIGRRTLPAYNFEHYYEVLHQDIKKRIHIINQTDFKNLLYWYKAASLFIYPSLAEGFGIPPIEAGASGVPCICSNATAMSDFTIFGKNLIDVSNSDILKNAIINALNNPDMSNNTNEVARNIKEKYNWESIAKKYHDILLNL